LLANTAIASVVRRNELHIFDCGQLQSTLSRRRAHRNLRFSVLLAATLYFSEQTAFERE
jgi:hypothetical protein